MRYGIQYLLRTAFSLAAGIFVSIYILSCDAVLGPSASGDNLHVSPSGAGAARGHAYEHLLDDPPDRTSMHMRGGYYLWKKGNTWHIRVSRTEGPPTMYGSAPVFSGRINVRNGFFSLVDSGGITQRPFSDFQHTRNDIFFKIRPRERVEGFDFEVQPAGLRYCLTIDLQHNFDLASSLVHLGRSMLTPDSLPLYLCYPY